MSTRVQKCAFITITRCLSVRFTLSTMIENSGRGICVMQEVSLSLSLYLLWRYVRARARARVYTVHKVLFVQLYTAVDGAFLVADDSIKPCFPRGSI